MKNALFRLKDELEMFGENNPTITVKRSDLALLVNAMFFKGEEWSNQAALGYAILAANEMGLKVEVISQLVANMYRAFDNKTIEEAAAIYRDSSY